jgi:hypothetical protein
MGEVTVDDQAHVPTSMHRLAPRRS